MRITTHEKCYAPFSENTILYDKILFLAAIVQCTSSSRQDLEVTELCQALDGRCGAINPNKVDVRGTEIEIGREGGGEEGGKKEKERTKDEGHRMDT